MPLVRWSKHRLVCALEPDEEARKKYLTGIALLKSIRHDPASDSLWAPREMRPGYARCIDSGRDAFGLYPPNVTTESHSVLLIKTS